MSELKLNEEQLNGLTTKELLEIAKRYNLPRYNGKNRKTKTELISMLLNYCEENDLVIMEQEDVLETVDIPIGALDESEKNAIYEDVKHNNVENVEQKPWEFQSREIWIEKSEPGVLMAFFDSKGKPRTGAMVNRSSKRKEVKLVTEFGMEFIVPYENILWVKRGTRWPKGIYNLLKGRV